MYLVKRPLVFDLGINGKGFKSRKIMLINKYQLLFHIHVSIEVDKTVGRMVVTSVKIQEFLVSKIRDVHRITTGLAAIGGIREQRVHDLTLQNIVR